jgi:predicted CXXCH cytochrome family protein
MTRKYLYAGAVLLAAALLILGTASAQQVKVDEPGVCLTCHDDFNQTLKSKHVHTPLKTTGKCSQCHNPHAGRHNALLLDNTKDVCYRCHADEKAKLSKAVVHDPVSKGECLSCHDAHASQFHDQLKAATTQVCISCHEQAKGWMASPVKHDPMVNGSCTTCHDAHSSDNHGLTKQDIYTLCSSCHKSDAQFSAVHKGYDLRGANCTACHNPHGSKSKGLIMPLQHSPFAANNCQACHSNLQSAAGKGFALKGKLTDLCLGCHKDVAQSYTALYRHVPPDKNECIACHNPHAAADAPLLKTDQKSLCFSCHGTKAGFAEDFKGSPHGDQSCTICHVPHGSDNEKFLVNETTDLCSQCHQHQHQITHPLGSGALDPRTKKPMTCTSCHQIHLAKAQPLLPLEGSRELCVQCHKGK